MKASIFPAPSSGCWLAVGYLLLLALNVGLHPPLLAADLLAPLLALTLVWQGRKTLAIIREKHFALPIFLSLAFLSSVYHTSRGSGNFYDFAVFSYMALLYVSFRLLPLDKRQQGFLGLGILLLLWFGFVVGGLSFCFPRWPGKALFFQDPHSAARGLNFLAVRYQFLFSNPNLLGSFYVLPIALLQPRLRQLCRASRTTGQWLLLLSLTGILLLPLFSTASKHLLLTLAVLAGTLLEAWPEKRRWLAPPAGAALLLLASVSLLTVIWPVFPLRRQSPYLNLRYQGNYTIHQEIYLKMLAADKSSWLTGLGARTARQRYPDFADRDKIASIMAEYQSLHCVEPYCSFMDPHNEYLNLATLFGLPAAICCFAFWLQSGQPSREGLLLFLLALLFCCLWDDLLSKRWLWVSLALMARNAQPENKSSG